MKRKFSKILGVGLTLALLASLLLTAAPVSAVTTPVVTLADGPATNPAYEISKLNVYTILFTTGAKVLYDEDIVVVFDAGVDISAITTTDVAIESTAGLGGNYNSVPGDGFPAGTPPDVAAVTGTYPAAQTLTITLSATATDVIGAGAIVQLTIGDVGANCVTNPDAAGTYNLTVATSQEAAVTSGDYTIKVPTIAGLPGVASVYNPTGVLMAQKNDLSAAITAAGADYTIQVGPGTYIASIIDISHDGLMFVSTDGAATTIIDTTGKSGYAVTVSGDEAGFDGFTVTTDDVGAIKVTGADATVENNIITADAGYPEGIRLTSSGAIVSGNELSIYTTMMVIGASDCALSDNTFGAGVNLQAGTGITITGNTIIGSEGTGIVFEATGDFEDILIEGNTISQTTLGTDPDAGISFRTNVGNVAKLQIVGNDITDNKGDGIRIPSNVTLTDSVIKFNTITGNEGYGINSDVAVDATLNWWSPDGASVGGTGTVTTAPLLADTAEAVLSASKVATAAPLDAKDTVGIKVSVSAGTVDTIVVAKYIANPQEALADALAFYDVYVAGTFSATDTATIKFYAGDANTEVYIWSADTETWGAVTPVAFSAYGGYVYVTVDPAMLAGTPFALVAVEPEATVLGLPSIVVPEVGAVDVSLTPTFDWGPVAGADGYYFQLADNPVFAAFAASPLLGDVGPLIETVYTHRTPLEYNKVYHWRVKAVSGTIEAGDLLESAWVENVFITMDEPVEPVEPADVILEPADVILEQPDVIVTVPAATPITPTWIYVIIAVGAVLVIALLVLIVRTRRVA